MTSSQGVESQSRVWWGVLTLSGGLLFSLGSFGTTQSEQQTDEATPAPPPAVAATTPAPVATTPPPTTPTPSATTTRPAAAAASTSPAGAAAGTTPATSPVAPLLNPGESLTNLTRLTNEPMSFWPVVSPDGSYLVYVVREKGRESDLVLKRNFAGSAVTFLTSFPSAEKQPAISPDGAQVAFASDQAGNFDIYTMAVNGGVARRQVTSSVADEEQPDWSPSGHLIAYSARSPQDGRWYVWVKDLRSGAPTLYGEGLYPRFSPDGKLLLFQRPAPGADGLFTLWTMDLEGSNLTQLLEPQGWGAIQPCWSPDGRHILFAATTGEAARIYTLPRTGPGNKYVSLTGGTQLWVVGVDGTGLTQLTNHAADDWYPRWTRNHELLFTSTRDGWVRIWQSSLPAELAPPKPAPPAKTAATRPATGGAVLAPLASPPAVDPATAAESPAFIPLGTGAASQNPKEIRVVPPAPPTAAPPSSAPAAPAPAAPAPAQL